MQISEILLSDISSEIESDLRARNAFAVSILSIILHWMRTNTGGYSDSYIYEGQYCAVSDVKDLADCDRASFQPCLPS